MRDIWKTLWLRRWRWVRRPVLATLTLVLLWWLAVLGGSFPMERLTPTEASSLTIRDARGTVLRQEATAAGSMEAWVGLEDVSPHLLHATLASEDSGFYEHEGVDWLALSRAVWLNAKRGKLAFGGSTITMQLVRLTAGTPRSLRGKLEQAVLAARLERELGKDEILEHYINRVYYGSGVWGAEQAAQFYFGKDASELSLGEAALLAVIPRGPTRYSPFQHYGRAFRRRSHILRLMKKRGFIDEDQRRLAERTPLEFVRRRPNFRAPHFVEYVKRGLPPEMRKGAEVESTLDWDLQRRIEVAVGEHLARLAGRNVTQAAVVVMRNSDGAILSMVGSRDYGDHRRNGAFNGALARLRPGSTLKPFVYATAIEQGDTPATLALDVVLPEDRNQFYSKDVKSHGFARYREALAGSFNLSAVHTLQRVGVKSVLAKLRRAGLVTLDKEDGDYDWGLAIGHAEVRLLDLVGAFSLFGRGGRPVTPRSVLAATAPDGRYYEEPAVEGERIFSEEIAFLLFDILSDPDARKPMFGDRVPMNLPFPVALKTGTTKAYTDNWAVGVTREYTVGVWAGNFDGSPTHQVMSVQGATPLMRAVYTAVAARYGDPSGPSRPDAVVAATVCPVSGKRRGPRCHHGKRELFVAGHVPTETCDWHQEVCGETRVVFPAELRAWADDAGRLHEGTCQEEEGDGLRIVTPRDGARFLLEPHRPPQTQRPIFAALPAAAAVTWTVDGKPAEEWTPSPGTHVVRAHRGARSDEVTVVYE